VSDAQALAERRKHEADVAAEEARNKEREAKEAQRAAKVAEDKAEAMRIEGNKAAELADKVKKALDQSLKDAESELKRQRIRCSVIGQKERIQSGGCPPGDPLCSSLASGYTNAPPPPQNFNQVNRP